LLSGFAVPVLLGLAVGDGVGLAVGVLVRVAVRVKVAVPARRVTWGLPVTSEVCVALGLEVGVPEAVRLGV